MFKIAFCFLTYGDLERCDIWRDYFDMTRCNIYIHSKEKVRNGFFSKFEMSEEKKVATRTKGGIQIVQAMLALFREALEADGENEAIIFLSQACLPLVSFDELYKIVVGCSGKSVIKRFDKNGVLQNRYGKLGECVRRDMKVFTKQHAQMILARKHTVALVKEAVGQWLRGYVGVCCSDELFFVNSLLMLGFEGEIFDKQICFCNPKVDRTQARTWERLGKRDVMGLRGMGFLFVRKVERGCKLWDGMREVLGLTKN